MAVDLQRAELCANCRAILAAFGRNGGLVGGRARIATMTPGQLAKHTNRMRAAKAKLRLLRAR